MQSLCWQSTHLHGCWSLSAWHPLLLLSLLAANLFSRKAAWSISEPYPVSWSSLYNSLPMPRGAWASKDCLPQEPGAKHCTPGTIRVPAGIPRLSRSPRCPSRRTTEEATGPRGKPPVPLAVQQHRRRKYHQFSSLHLRKDTDSVSQHPGDTLTFPDLLFSCHLSPFHRAPGAFAKHCCWVWAIYPQQRCLPLLGHFPSPKPPSVAQSSTGSSQCPGSTAHPMTAVTEPRAP